MARHHHKTVVRREHPLRATLWRAGAAVLVMAAIGIAYWFGYRAQDETFVPLNATSDAMRSQLIDLETRLDVETKAVAQLRQELADSRGSIDELERELAFYREVMAPEEVDQGVVVRPPVLTRSAVPGHWRYQLVTQSGEGGRTIHKGDLRAVIGGRLGDLPHEVTLSEIDAAQLTDALTISFRYFQRFEGELVLPPGFQPTYIDIELSLTKPQTQNLETRYAWEDVAVDDSNG